jgi:hypothetical protein
VARARWMLKESGSRSPADLAPRPLISIFSSSWDDDGRTGIEIKLRWCRERNLGWVLESREGLRGVKLEAERVATEQARRKRKKTAL